jgi:Fuc2NAc and GlcNAc transferase
MLILVLMGLASTAGLWAFMRLAPRLGLVDRPNHRSLHTVPTVLGGGVVPVVLIAGYLFVFAPMAGAHGVAWLLLILGAIGVSDDKWGLPSGPRFVSYLLAGIALPWLLLPVAQPLSFIALIGFLALGVSVAWCINLFNFMDGADGFATVQLLCVSLGLSLIGKFGPIHAEALVWCSGALLSCSLPLLVFNWPPARLFLGDAGAIPLGFFLAVLGVLAGSADTSLGAAWLILMMPFLIDSGVTLCWRLLSGDPPHMAHRDHAYQRLVLRIGSPFPVTLGLMALQIAWQFPLAVTAVNSELFPSLLVLLSAIPSLLILVYSRSTQ